jgi:hypothetical protein
VSGTAPSGALFIRGKQCNNVGSFLGATGVSLGPVTATLQRGAVIGVAVANAAFIQPNIYMSVNNGEVVNATIRFYAANVERGIGNARPLLQRNVPEVVADIGDYDAEAVLSFVGSGNGFIVTWYDQSGNARNATQTTAAAQPRIVSNGAIETENGRPVLRPDGVDDTMVVSPSGVTTYPLSINAVVFRQDANENGAWVKVGGDNPDGVGIGIGSSTFDVAGTSLIGLKENVAWAPTSATVASQAIVTMLQPSGTTATEIYQNGVSAAITAGATDAPLAPSPSISLFGYGTTRFPSNPMAEVIDFLSLLSTTDRQILERNQGAYYGITVA